MKSKQNRKLQEKTQRVSNKLNSKVIFQNQNNLSNSESEQVKSLLMECLQIVDEYKTNISLDIDNVSDMIFNLNKQVKCGNIYFVTNQEQCSFLAKFSRKEVKTIANSSPSISECVILSKNFSSEFVLPDCTKDKKETMSKINSIVHFMQLDFDYLSYYETGIQNILQTFDHFDEDFSVSEQNISSISENLDAIVTILITFFQTTKNQIFSYTSN